MDLARKELVFVTGKGGVGKSLAAAALAWQEARKGRRVCLVELGQTSFYESFFETRGIGYDPIEVFRDVHIALYNPADCLREYVLHYLRVGKLYDIFFQNKVMKAFLNAAPALGELAILGKLTGHLRGITKSEYDVYIIDCFSTGHALALLRAPRGLSSTFRAGPIYEQASEMDAILKDSTMTHFVLVALAEDMPVNETLELHKALSTEFHAGIEVIANKLLAPPVSRVERDQLLTGLTSDGVRAFIEYLDYKEGSQNGHLKKLVEIANPLYGVPQILRAQTAQDKVESFAANLEAPWILTN